MKWFTLYTIYDISDISVDYQTTLSSITSLKSLPKKIKIFDNSQGKSNFYEYTFPKFNSSGNPSAYFNLTTDSEDNYYTNDNFVYFKKKYTVPLYLLNLENIVSSNSSYSDINPPLAITSMAGNNISDYIYGYNDYNLFYDSITAPSASNFSNTMTSANTRTAPNSFKTENVAYQNNYIDIKSEISTAAVSSFHSINYIIDGKYELTFSSGIKTGQSKASYYNFLAKLEMNPQFSSTISVPDDYVSYDKILYIINDLFLSSLPKSINGFSYNNLKIVDDHIISNVFYVNYNIATKKYYKGLGRIGFKLNCSSIINNTGDLDSLNLINYEEVKFPSWFTERYISRFNSIPRIKNIFTTLNQGNIFNSLKYYAYLSYSTIEDVGTVNENDQILYMTTDIDTDTILENRGIPFTKSLSEGTTLVDIEKIAKFEPYNSFLFTAAYWCF